MTERDLSRGLRSANGPPSYGIRAPRTVPTSSVILPSGRQLWRLNEQGLLRLDVPAVLELGLPADLEQITHAEAKAALAHTLDTRWHGLGRYPRKGEIWAVRDGLVVSLGVQETDE